MPPTILLRPFHDKLIHPLTNHKQAACSKRDAFCNMPATCQACQPGPALPTILLRLFHDKLIILIASTQPKRVGCIIRVIILKRIQARLGSLANQQAAGLRQAGGMFIV